MSQLQKILPFRIPKLSKQVADLLDYVDKRWEEILNDEVIKVFQDRLIDEIWCH